MKLDFFIFIYFVLPNICCGYSTSREITLYIGSSTYNGNSRLPDKLRLFQTRIPENSSANGPLWHWSSASCRLLRKTLRAFDFDMDLSFAMEYLLKIIKLKSSVIVI